MYVLVSAHYPMSALSTVIICRQVVEAATAVAFFFEDDEWCVPVSINLIGRRENVKIVYVLLYDEIAVHVLEMISMQIEQSFKL